jgi:Na+/H+-dicarboxylate symporter
MNNVFYLGGNLFIKLMKMLVVPLVFFSIVVGVASISDIRTIGSIGGTTILIYLITTALAVTIALMIGMYIPPGAGLHMSDIGGASNLTINQTMTDTILNLVPDNPFSSLATGDMLPVIIFGLLIGIILAKLREETETFNKIFTEGNKIMMEMTSIVMKFAPIGVFCLMAKTFGGLGFDGILPLGKYFVCVLIGLAIQGFVVYPSLLVLFTRLNPIKFFKRFFSVMFFAFSSSTSNATIPLNMEKLHEMGVSRDVSSFTIPLGATINMDGTAIMQGVAVMFAAQAYGIDLGTSALLTVIFTAVMASVGTAGIPSVGLVTLTMVFNSVGLPVQAASLPPP